jgi:hypothetical protein
MSRGDLTDSQWELIQPHLPKEKSSATGCGRAYFRVCKPKPTQKRLWSGKALPSTAPASKPLPTPLAPGMSRHKKGDLKRTDSPDTERIRTTRLPRLRKVTLIRHFFSLFPKSG